MGGLEMGVREKERVRERRREFEREGEVLMMLTCD
jgi:hypothetical protein